MKINKPDYLPSHIDWRSSSSPERLAADLSVAIEQMFNQALSANSRASIAVSGGRTPVALFNKISQLKIDWSRMGHVIP